MPSAFDTEFQSLVVPDVIDTFGEDATFTPRYTKNPAYAITAIWERPLAERNKESSLEINVDRWSIVVRAADLLYPTKQGDMISRTVAGETRTYRLVSDTLSPIQEDDDSGGAFVRLHAIKVET